ncbi:MAG TPA: patatin-like phospholipase family protein [Kiritimatiellia bacterium]|nr:patatin-like phospholipase family protein [Kiritimatiellia bacterium]
MKTPPLPPGARVGLALGGGGARGWAHLGVLRALKEHNIQPVAIAGTSIGALVGGFLAAGKLHHLQDIAEHLDLKQLLTLFAEPSLPRSGLIEGQKITALLREKLQATDLARLPVPFRAVASDIITGEQIVLDQGDLSTAIRASIAIPGLFATVPWNGRHLADGGLVNPLPINIVRTLNVNYVIAVDLHGGWRHPASPPPATFKPSPPSTPSWIEKQRRHLKVASKDALRKWLRPAPGPSIITVMTNTIDIVAARLTRETLSRHPADLLIQPQLGDIGHLEFHRYSEASNAGYTAALHALKHTGQQG